MFFLPGPRNLQLSFHFSFRIFYFYVAQNSFLWWFLWSSPCVISDRSHLGRKTVLFFRSWDGSCHHGKKGIQKLLVVGVCGCDFSHLRSPGNRNMGWKQRQAITHQSVLPLWLYICQRHYRWLRCHKVTEQHHQVGNDNEPVELLHFQILTMPFGTNMFLSLH